MENQKQASKADTKKGIIIALLLIIAFCAYGYYDLVLKDKINGSTLIDNPTSQAITVQIDGQTYQVPANQYVKIDLELGKHKISCKQTGLSNEELNIDPVPYGVINPTQSKYVIYNIIFTEKDLRSRFKPYQVEGREIYSLLGEPRVTTDLFIPDLTSGKGNIDDKEPSSQSYNRMNQDYAFLTKIFRLADFFEFYDKNNK